MKAKLTNIKDKLVDALNELTDQHWLAIFGFFMVALVIGSMIIAPLSASALTPYPNVSLTVDNSNNVPLEGGGVMTYQNGAATSFDLLGTHTLQYVNADINVISNGDTIIMEALETGIQTTVTGNISAGLYNVYAMCTAVGQCLLNASNESQVLSSAYVYLNDDGGTYCESYYVVNGTNIDLNLYVPSQLPSNYYGNVVYILLPSNSQPPTQCPTLEEQIANYNGTWTEFLMMLRQNNHTLANSYQNNIDLAIQSGFQNGKEQGFSEGFSEGHTEGYAEGFNAGLNGLVTEDPIDQYWNSTKDTILIAGAPYFMPNGFGSIDATNTVGIYGLHTSYVTRQDGTKQAFQGQYVTEFASSGTLSGGWYKIGGTVGDPNAYEQTLTTAPIHDKAYYVAEFDENGTPTTHHLLAIWLDGYESWFVAEEFAHHGTVADGNKDYKQVYSIYLTDIPPTSQMFVNYDQITTNEFREDRGATLRLATFNQLNNYNVYSFNTNAVEQYHNGFDSGANSTLWLNLISQPIVAFFSIPLAQVIVEGVTYTLTYGIVLGAGIGALILIWFLKLFAGG